MRLLLSVAAAAGLALAAFAVGQATGADSKPPPKGSPDAPKSRADWPTERVVVIGRRGNPRDWISEHTMRGTEGFADGSAIGGEESRTEYPWQVYYQANGKLEAHFRKIGARVPHGPIEELDYVEFGSWRIDGEGDLCQTIPKVGWGTEICFYMDIRGSRIALYYTSCGAFNRCYPGRLGPEGDIVPGRAFTR